MSSLPENESFTAFLETSLVAMQQECPPAYHHMCEVLAPRQVQIEVDGEVVYLAFEPARVSKLPASQAVPTLRMQMSRRAILDLTGGRYTLQEAILNGAVSLHGDLKDLVIFHEGWLTYMRGAVRCPSFPDLLDRYRDGL